MSANIGIYDCIIVGGGCAGIKAAETLYTNGVENILVLEAQDRLGGRIQTILLDDNVKLPLELGANWLHGTKGNPLFELVQQNPDVFVHSKEKLFCENNILCHDHNGNQYNTNMCCEVDELLEDKILEEIRGNYKKTSYDSNINFEDYVKEKFEAHIENDGDDVKQTKRAMLQKSIYLQCIQNGTEPLSDCSIEEFGSYVEFEGKNYEFPGGYSKLIEFLANRLPDQAIRLNHAVEHITKPNQNLIVRCQNGSQFETRHLIVTCSLGYLKKHHEALFETGLLNESKIEAIQKLNIGLYHKSFFVYDDMSFFPKDVDAIHLISLNNDEQYFDEKNKWLLKIPEFEKVYDNVLRARLVGKTAGYVQSLSDEEICLEVTELLKRVLKNENIPLPRRLIRFLLNN